MLHSPSHVSGDNSSIIVLCRGRGAPVSRVARAQCPLPDCCASLAPWGIHFLALSGRGDAPGGSLPFRSLSDRVGPKDGRSDDGLRAGVSTRRCVG